MFTQSTACPDSPNNRPAYVIAQFDNNNDLHNRGVQVVIVENIATES